MLSGERVMALERLSKSFTPHRPIDLPDFFAGRINVLFRASDAVNTAGLHVILFGDRGTGKTSIAHVLAVGLQDQTQIGGRRAILTSCSSTDDYASIWRKVFQEIYISERQMGLVQGAPVHIRERLDVDSTITDPNDARLLIQSLPNPMIIIIDEFDRVNNANDTTKLMADTIKLFADANVRSTIILVGVAESIGELMAEHQSVTRNLAQIHVEPMNVDELSEIIQKGFQRTNLKYEAGLDRKIADLSQGYPHYTHLLGLWSGRHALQEGRDIVTYADLDKAIADALQNAAGGVQQEYERAVASARKDALFREVLLACSLAKKDPLGRFSAVEVRSPLRRLTGHDYDTGAFQSHLAKFCEPERGPVLKKSGIRRNYRWRFVNPQLIPYIRLQGISDGRISMDYSH